MNSLNWRLIALIALPGQVRGARQDQHEFFHFAGPLLEIVGRARTPLRELGFHLLPGRLEEAGVDSAERAAWSWSRLWRSLEPTGGHACIPLSPMAFSTAR